MKRRESTSRRSVTHATDSTRSGWTAKSSAPSAELLEMFQAIVTRDDVIHPKPHPEPYLVAARHLGVKPEMCLAIEDSHSGVRAAHSAGMQTVMVPDLVPPNDDIRALCIVMQSLHQVREAAFGQDLVSST